MGSYSVVLISEQACAQLPYFLAVTTLILTHYIRVMLISVINTLHANYE